MPKWLFLLAVAMCVLRLFFAGYFGLSEDEAYYWTWSQRLDVGYFDHPPMIAWWISMGNHVVHSEMGVRLLNSIAFPVWLWIFWNLSEKNSLALTILLSFPLFLGSFLATPDLPLLVFWSLTLWTFNSNRPFLMSIALAGALLSKLTGLLLLPILFISDPKRCTQRAFLAAFVGTALLYSPFIWWNAEHDWASFSFQWSHVRSMSKHLSFPLSQLLLMGIVFFPMTLFLMFRWKKTARLFYLATIPLILLGLLIGGEANWIAPAYIGAAVLLGNTTGKLRKLVHLGLSLNFFLQFLLVLHVIQPLRVIPTDPVHRLNGGKTLAEAVAAWNDPNIWCTRYQEASLIWFYSGISTHTLSNQGRKSQFDLWREELPPNGLFIRPFRNSSHNEMRSFQRETSPAFVVQAFSEEEQVIRQWQVFSFSPAPLP